MAPTSTRRSCTSNTSCLPIASKQGILIPPRLRRRSRGCRWAYDGGPETPLCPRKRCLRGRTRVQVFWWGRTTPRWRIGKRTRAAGIQRDPARVSQRRASNPRVSADSLLGLSSIGFPLFRMIDPEKRSKCKPRVGKQGEELSRSRCYFCSVATSSWTRE